METGRPFHVLVRYDDGSTVEADLRGRKADPNLRMPGAAVAARWIGQDRQDWTGTGPVGRPRRSPGRSDPSQQALDQGAPQGDSHRGSSRHAAGSSARTPSFSPMPSWSATPRTRPRATCSFSPIAI